MNAEDAAPAHTYTQIEIRCYYVRGRNALLARGRFSDLFLDYYLHLSDHKLKLTDEQDTAMKDALTAMTLHLASRPWNEHHAWNLHFEHPLLNLFVCGDNLTSKLAGRAFQGERRPDGQSLMVSQLQKKGMSEPRSSTVDLTGSSVFSAVERFYQQSEQRAARFFEVDDEDFILISAQPQCDLEWLEGLTTEKAVRLDQDEELSLLEQRSYHFECGCNARRICEILLPHCSRGPEELFGSDEHLDIGCRRCGAEYRIQREQFEAYLAARGDDS